MKWNWRKENVALVNWIRRAMRSVLMNWIDFASTVPCGRDPLFCPLRTSQGTVCYRLQTEPFYWEQAVKECDAKYQSDLTSIHSKEEINFIYEMVKFNLSSHPDLGWWLRDAVTHPNRCGGGKYWFIEIFEGTMLLLLINHWPCERRILHPSVLIHLYLNS